MVNQTILERRINRETIWQDCDDPLYILFSLQAWLDYNFNLDPYTDELLSHIKTCKELPVERILEIKRKIDTEWGEKTGVKLLYPDSQFNDFKNKNIVFIFANDILSKFPNTFGQTATFSHEGAVKLKMIILEEKLVERNSGLFWQTVLHEAGHAFSSLADVSPLELQEGIDCSKTIMAYADQCPKIQEAVANAQSNYIERVDALPIIEKMMPTTLGELDIASAQYYRKICAAKKRVVVTEKPVELPRATEKPVSSTIQYDVTRSQKTLIESLSLYANHFGSSFIQSFFITFIDRYIHPALMSADFSKTFIDNLCDGLKLGLNVAAYGSGYAIFNQFLQFVLPAVMRKIGASEMQIDKVKKYLHPALSIILSFQDGIILEKLLLQNATVILGNKTGAEFAQLLIRNMPKLKLEEALPFHFKAS